MLTHASLKHNTATPNKIGTNRLNVSLIVFSVLILLFRTAATDSWGAQWRSPHHQQPRQDHESHYLRRCKWTVGREISFNHRSGRGGEYVSLVCIVQPDFISSVGWSR